MLFDIPLKQEQESKHQQPSLLISSAEDSAYAKFEKFIDFKKKWDKVRTGEICHFVSEGRFSGHELLMFLLKDYNHSNAEVYIATWKISEDPARQIVQAKNKGIIGDLHLLVERRMTIKSPQALQLIQHNTTSFGMADCHAKVFVINDSCQPLTVVMSANFSNNPRIEAGVIDTTIEAAEFHVEWIKRNIDQWNLNKKN